MKRILFIITVLAGLLLACSPEKLPDGKKIDPITKPDPIETPSITASETSLSFSAEGGSQTVTITANFTWEIVSKPSWITISPSSGSNGSTIVTLTSDKTTSTSGRTGTITIGKSTSATISIAVSQSAAVVDDEISASKTSLVFSKYQHESQTVTITSNFDWKTVSKPSWIKISPYSGTNGSTIITVEVLSDLETIFINGQDLYEGKILLGDTQKSTVSISVIRPNKTAVVSSETFKVNGVSFKMIRVDGGTFMMGATAEQGSDAYDDEKPAHSVTLSTYYIGETEVTQELWEAVMGNNPSFFKNIKHPVECVSWNDCKEFINKLNALTGKIFRLPTEAEWEYAARGGSKSKGYKYAGGNNIGNVAWYESNSGFMTHEVAIKAANELGLYDMSGNVWEWCQDWKDIYSSSSQTNPSGPSSGSYRVIRGGSWLNSARSCRVSIRSSETPNDQSYHLGLRLAL